MDIIQDNLLDTSNYFWNSLTFFIKYWPNYYENSCSSQRLATQKSVYDQEYIYFGGKKGYSVKLLTHFTSLFLRLYTGFENFQYAFNLSIKKYSVLTSDKEPVSTSVTAEIFPELQKLSFDFWKFTDNSDSISLDSEPLESLNMKFKLIFMRVVWNPRKNLIWLSSWIAIIWIQFLYEQCWYVSFISNITLFYTSTSTAW